MKKIESRWFNNFHFCHDESVQNRNPPPHFGLSFVDTQHNTPPPPCPLFHFTPSLPPPPCFRHAFYSLEDVALEGGWCHGSMSLSQLSTDWEKNHPLADFCFLTLSPPASLLPCWKINKIFSNKLSADVGKLIKSSIRQLFVHHICTLSMSLSVCTYRWFLLVWENKHKGVICFLLIQSDFLTTSRVLRCHQK